MIIKLYKNSDGVLHYWEAWNGDNEVTLHWGVAGDEGNRRHIKLSPDNDFKSIIEFEAASRRAEGYREIEHENLQRLIIQYAIVEMGTVADLDKRYKVEHLMNERLGWTGLGHCDGGDIGSGTMNVFCYVVDADKATQVVTEELRAYDLLADANIFLISKDEDVQLLFPIQTPKYTQ